MIGTALRSYLEESDPELLIFSRSPSKHQAICPREEAVEWDVVEGPPPVLDSLSDLDAFVHLAGAPINRWPWSDERKRMIRNSRVIGTRNLVEGFRRVASPPKVLISGSAVGLYGDRGDERLDEESRAGEGYLPEVCREWEAEARQAVGLGCRVILLRTGLVLANEGGLLAAMLSPFKWGLGAVLGSGSQYMPWIHLRDEIRLIHFVVENAEISGPLNATAPNPVTNRIFTRTLADMLNRPVIFWAPKSILRLGMGEMSQLALEGQRAVPAKAQKSGFEFEFSELETALKDLLEP